MKVVEVAASSPHVSVQAPARGTTGRLAAADVENLLLSTGLVSEIDRAEVSRLSGGHSHVTWAVRCASEKAYVVKVAQPDGPLAPYDVHEEAAFMRLAAAGGLPAPEVVHVGDERAAGAQYFVMRMVEGTAPVPREVVGWLAERPGVAAEHLAENVVRVLADMASIRPAEAPTSLSTPDHYRQYIDDVVETMIEKLDGRAPVPATVRLVRRALSENAEVLGQPALGLVHGDFRFGNLMLDDSGAITAILDWERGMWGHPLHDLAYLSLPSMGYEGRVAGLVEDDRLLAIWQGVTGAPADATALAYLRTVSIFTELCSCIRALGGYMSGRGRTSVLRILPIIARHEADLLRSLDTWGTDGRAA